MRRDADRETAREELRAAVARAVLLRSAHLDAALMEALVLGCGVSVVGTHTAYVVRADVRVPFGAIWEAPTDSAIDVAADHSECVEGAA